MDFLADLLSNSHSCRDARVVELVSLTGGVTDILVFTHRSNAEARADILNGELDDDGGRDYMWVVAASHGGYVVQKRDRHTNRIVHTF